MNVPPNRGGGGPNKAPNNSKGGEGSSAPTTTTIPHPVITTNSTPAADEASKAASALAAVAAAATANHKSPRTAAQEAKDLAQSLITSNSSSNVGRSVCLEHLQGKLSHSWPEHFLEFLLHLEKYKVAKNASSKFDRAAIDKLNENSIMILGAYETIQAKLDGGEDLLPPCNVPNGDVTLSFFHACVQQDTASTTVTHSTSNPGGGNSPPAHNNNNNNNWFKKPTKFFRKQQSAPLPNTLKPGEYQVSIDREMLGLTVENVLERTVVRTVLNGGPAKKAGAKIGSLIVGIGNIQTKHLTHFETIDELRQSNRPLVLILRQIAPESLRAAREEMGRLILGSGFGELWHSESWNLKSYTSYLQQKLHANNYRSKKEEAVSITGMKLIWILCLMVYGLNDIGNVDAAKSISKVLLDYYKNFYDSEKPILDIGDVISRTMGFMGDHTCKVSAMLRSEIISFLCDVLDLDTEQELSEEGDLGPAGSLLKLIVTNCPLMKSPGCDDIQIDELEWKRRYGNLECADPHSLHAGNRFLAVVHRLAASKSTSARIAACSLGPVLWGHLDFPHQLQLRGVITRALHDVEVAVRKSTATVLHEIAELVFDKRSVPWLVLMCERAMTDPEPQLRSAAMTLTWHLAEHLPNAFYGDARQGSMYLRRLPSRDDPLFADVYLLQCKLLPVATRLAEDRSPSVRLAVAAQCDRLCDALGDHWSSVVIDVLLGLLSDSDERVRCEAASCVPRLSEIVLNSKVSNSEVSVLEALMPAALKLHKDGCANVRVSLATAAGELLTILVNLQRDEEEKFKFHIDDRLIPMVQRLLNDPDPEVTSAGLRAVTNATRSSRQRHVSVASVDDDSSHHSQSSSLFYPVLSEAQVLRLLPTLTELGSSKQWRVRQSAVEIVPALLSCSSQFDTRSEISKLCKNLINDPVDAVRKTAADCLCGTTEELQWISEIVLPAIRECAEHKSMKQRLLSLKMIQNLLNYHSHKELVELACSLKEDPIANVRLNVGRTLEPVLVGLNEPELNTVLEALNSQIESEEKAKNDPDVLYFAKSCLIKTQSLLNERNAASETSQLSTPDEAAPSIKPGDTKTESVVTETLQPSVSDLSNSEEDESRTPPNSEEPTPE